MPDTNNDINAPLANYVIKGKEYITDYHLTDSIYKKWSNNIQTIHESRTSKKKYFAMK